MERISGYRAGRDGHIETNGQVNRAMHANKREQHPAADQAGDPCSHRVGVIKQADGATNFRGATNEMRH